MSLVREFDGLCPYNLDDTWEGHRMLVSVPCYVGNDIVPIDAMLDTGAEWCVLPLDYADSLDDSVVEGVVRLHTRFGLLEGQLMRCPVRFAAAEGLSVSVEATWFVSEHWFGPAILGWKGCLERFRFALDQRDSSFCFGEL